MEFYDFLVKKYGYNEAIQSNELSFDGYSVPWIKKALKKMCDDGRLVRFEKGIYYLPTETSLGKSKLDPRKVIIKKYIRNGNETIGYFSGMTFLNMLGLSNQMPNTLEIYTNNEQAKVREVQVGSQKTVLRRSRTVVDNENAATMSFLELMNFTNSSFYGRDGRQKVADYIRENGITRKTVSECAPFFPDKAMRTMVESGIVYDIQNLN